VISLRQCKAKVHEVVWLLIRTFCFDASIVAASPDGRVKLQHCGMHSGIDGFRSCTGAFLSVPVGEMFGIEEPACAIPLLFFVQV